jgi:hypothetical protein
MLELKDKQTYHIYDTMLRPHFSRSTILSHQLIFVQKPIVILPDNLLFQRLSINFRRE